MSLIRPIRFSLKVIAGIKIASRSIIPLPFPPPARDFTVLAGDWFKQNHIDLKAILDSGTNLPFLDGHFINGRASNAYSISFAQFHLSEYTQFIAAFGSQNTLLIVGMDGKYESVDSRFLCHHLHDCRDHTSVETLS